MEQEYALWTKTFFDFSSLYTLSWGNLVFSKVFSSLSSEYNFFDFFSCCRSVTSILPFHKICAVSGLDYPKKNECSFKLLASLLVWETRRGDIPYSSNTAFLPFFTFFLWCRKNRAVPFRTMPSLSTGLIPVPGGAPLQNVISRYAPAQK